MRRLQIMGIEAIHPRGRTSRPGAGHRVDPYLLGLEINGPNQVWCSAITGIPLRQGFMCLVAVMDWWSRYVLAWERALGAGGKVPAISNSEQGSQARRTSRRWPRRARR